MVRLTSWEQWYRAGSAAATRAARLVDASNLWRVPVAGGSPVKLVPAENYGFADGPMVVDDTSVYLVASGGQAIVKVAK